MKIDLTILSNECTININIFYKYLVKVKTVRLLKK